MEFIIRFCAIYLIYFLPAIAFYYIFQNEKRSRAMKDVYVFTIVAGASWYCAHILKNIFKTPRPSIATDILSQSESIYGFPSGHTALGIGLATILYFHHKRLSYIVVLLALIIGLSRVWVHVHSYVDIIGGILVGIIIGIFSRVIYNRLRKDNY